MLRLDKIAKKILCFSLVLTSFSCAKAKIDTAKIDPFDRITDLTRSDIRKTMVKDRKAEKLKQDEEAQNEAPIPTLSKLIISPPPPVIGGDKIISFSVTEQVPLKDVLIELGRVAKIDIDLDPNISGGIIINAKNRPLKEVIDRIASLGNLRYSYKNGVLFFERDTPYMKNYFVDYLIGGTLWTDVEANITAILNSSDAPANSNSSETATVQAIPKSSFTANKSAGIISLFATEKQHAAISKYLADVEKHASAQVLIEAKVVEVTLSDTYKTGINWSWVNGTKSSVTTQNGYDSTQPIAIVLSGLFDGSNLSASVSALEKFGETKTISSPRIHAMNNQKAMLNFADKLVYFKVDQAQSSSSNGTSTSIVATTTTSTKQEENVGVELSITPSINLKTGEIIMNIQPKLSVKSTEVTDPASPRTTDGTIITALKNVVPVIQTRQLETIAKIQSGNVVVIGGLMKETATNTETGIPFLGRIPILGWFFKSVSKVSEVVETVIFVKATIVNSGAPAGKVDRDLQEKFDPDRRRYFN